MKHGEVKGYELQYDGTNLIVDQFDISCNSEPNVGAKGSVYGNRSNAGQIF